MTLGLSYKMNGWWLMGPLGLLLILASAYSAAGEQADISLRIAVPVENGQRTIQVGRQATPFQVIIENISGSRVNLWREWCSWGYFNLKFQITDETGVTWIVKKKEKEWEKNFPDFVAIDPGGKMVIDVTLNPDVWENIVPPGTKQSTTVSMFAIYESEDSKDAIKEEIWSGRLVSDEKKYTLIRQSD